MERKLRQAIREDDTAQLRKLPLSIFQDKDARHIDNRIAAFVHSTFTHHSLECLKYFLEIGANIQQRDQMGVSVYSRALYKACREKFTCFAVSMKHAGFQCSI